ncbi:BnaC05g40660D [Brassica napus]|uniref:BnaC05g40660D protein n=1 Tax=Brassica napus TaxID=3708 RepID=A0A078HZH7_BRANA|nr:BnaC05g40660D [Brassica napus]
MKMQGELEEEQALNKALRGILLGPVMSQPRLSLLLLPPEANIIEELTMVEAEITCLEKQIQDLKHDAYSERKVNQELEAKYDEREERMMMMTTPKKLLQRQNQLPWEPDSDIPKMRSKDLKQRSKLQSCEDPHVLDGNLFGTQQVIARERRVKNGFKAEPLTPEERFFQTQISVLQVLKEKLSKVDLSFLNHKKKMTFWINTYNACVMNGFLEHGLPSSKEKLLTILKMATIDVGGTQLSALDIEGSILHSPCKPLEALSTDVHKRYGFRCVEPNLMFVLCRGDWSSPALRVYTAEDVVNELIKARTEYLEASIGISGRKKIVIPRFLHKRLRDFADDEGTLVEWICRQLPPGQRCLQLKETAMEWLKKQSESSLNKLIEVRPHEYEFRYLLHL